jgi:hypothetical protein
MDNALDPAKYKDEYQEKLRGLIETKISAKRLSPLSPRNRQGHRPDGRPQGQRRAGQKREGTGVRFMIQLDAYKKKRNFDRTGEPEGEEAVSGNGLRFAVQHHLAHRDHYDLRLEWDGALLSWAVPKGPSYDPGESCWPKRWRASAGIRNLRGRSKMRLRGAAPSML